MPISRTMFSVYTMYWVSFSPFCLECVFLLSFILSLGICVKTQYPLVCVCFDHFDDILMSMCRWLPLLTGIHRTSARCGFHQDNTVWWIQSICFGEIEQAAMDEFQKYVFVEEQIHGLPSQTMFESPAVLLCPFFVFYVVALNVSFMLSVIFWSMWVAHRSIRI